MRAGRRESTSGAIPGRSSAHPTPARTSTSSTTFNYSTTMLGRGRAQAGLARTGGGGVAAHERPGSAVRADRTAAGSPKDGAPTSSVFDESTIGPAAQSCTRRGPAGRRGAPLRRGRGDRARARERRRDRARRCVHRRAARPAAAVRPRHRDRHRAGRSRLNPARSLGAPGCREPRSRQDFRLGPRCGNTEPRSGAAVRLTHTLPHRNGDGTTSGPLPEVDQVLPRPSAATGPTAATGRHGKSRPAKKDRISVGEAGSGQSASSTRRPAKPIIRATEDVWLGNGSPPRCSHVVDLTGGIVTRDASRTSTLFSS